jgi:hypothetical protein
MRSAVFAVAALAIGAEAAYARAPLYPRADAVMAPNPVLSTGVSAPLPKVTPAPVGGDEDEDCDEDDMTSTTRYTTSTLQVTKLITVTSCPPTVTNCPNKPYVTSTVVIETTVCPVVEAVPTWPAKSGAVPPYPTGPAWNPPAGPTAAVVVPQPGASTWAVPQPSKPAGSVPPPAGTGVPPAPAKPTTPVVVAGAGKTVLSLGAVAAAALVAFL